MTAEKNRQYNKLIQARASDEEYEELKRLAKEAHITGVGRFLILKALGLIKGKDS